MSNSEPNSNSQIRKPRTTAQDKPKIRSRRSFLSLSEYRALKRRKRPDRARFAHSHLVIWISGFIRHSSFVIRHSFFTHHASPFTFHVSRFTLLALALLTSCSIGPNYHRPA